MPELFKVLRYKDINHIANISNMVDFIYPHKSKIMDAF